MPGWAVFVHWSDNFVWYCLIVKSFGSDEDLHQIKETLGSCFLYICNDIHSYFFFLNFVWPRLMYSLWYVSPTSAWILFRCRLHPYWSNPNFNLMKILELFIVWNQLYNTNCLVDHYYARQNYIRLYYYWALDVIIMVVA